MALQALILTRDRDMMKLFARAFEAASIQLHAAITPMEALKRLMRGKFDAVIIDCDDVTDSLDVLETLRGGKFNKTAIAFAVLNGGTSVKAAYDAGANFILEKPVTAEALTKSLRAAHGLIVRERLRYHRHPLDAHAKLRLESEAELSVAVLNVSEGGMGVILQHKPQDKLVGRLQLEFHLPNSSVPISGKGEIAWQLEDGRIGVRFFQLDPTSKRELDSWMQKNLELYPIV